MSVTPCMPKFGSLPTELKEAILYACPDLTTVWSLARSCRVMHELYVYRRRALLEKSLQLPVLVDAIAVLFARTERQQVHDELKMPYTGLKDFLDKYHPLRKALNAPSSKDEAKCTQIELNVYDVFASLCDSDIDCLIKFHREVEFILNDMVQSFEQLRPNIKGQKTTTTDTVHLSSSESFRMMRALYRLEIFYLLFEDMVEFNHPEASGSWTEVNCFRDFLQIYAPWELEEIKCARKYLFRIYKQLPGASCWEDDFEGMAGQRWANYPPRHIMEVELIEDKARFRIDDEIRELYVAKGLEYAYTWLRACHIPCPAERFVQQRAIAHEDIIATDYYGGAQLAFTATVGPEYAMRFSRGRPQESTFLCDEDWNTSSLAWMWCLDEGDSAVPAAALYNDMENPLCQWGYVFWDQHRLEKWEYNREILGEEMKHRLNCDDEDEEWSMSY